VHLAPVRAGHVARPEEYRWSSYRFFAGDNGDLPPIFLDTRTTFAAFHQDIHHAREEYVNYVASGIDGYGDNPLKATRLQSVLGSDAFVEGIKRNFLQMPHEIKQQTNGTVKIKQKGDEITVERINTALSTIKEANEKTKRKMRLYYLRKFTGKTLDEIVNMLDKPLTITAISKTVSRLEAERLGNPVLDVLMQQVEERLNDGK
jgi:hypothetical protein